MIFKAVSVTGVNQSKTWIKNDSVKNFNSQLQAKVKSAGCSNLSYVSILSGTDVNTIIAGGKKVAIVNYMSGDGLHYTKDGYSFLWKAMKSKI